ncbi:hypothetical protein Pmar_PMAR004571, partial [Perkinsus marinus ATCC 50983]
MPTEVVKGVEPSGLPMSEEEVVGSSPSSTNLATESKGHKQSTFKTRWQQLRDWHKNVWPGANLPSSCWDLHIGFDTVVDRSARTWLQYMGSLHRLL